MQKGVLTVSERSVTPSTMANPVQGIPGYDGPQSEIPSTASHSGQDHTFGVFGGSSAASMRSTHCVMSASQFGQIVIGTHTARRHLYCIHAIGRTATRIEDPGGGCECRPRPYGSVNPIDRMANDQMDELESEFDVDFEEGLPESVDRAAIRRMRTVALLLDDSIPVPGTNQRIGIDPIVGVLPGAGDAITAGLSLYIVYESARLGVSYGTLTKMLANVSLDVAGGSIPLVGDVFDATWKANKRNVQLVLEDLATESDVREEEDVTHIEVE